MRIPPGTLVLGLPRGGIVVAYEIARELGLPLDVFLVRKLGVPGYEELAMGAIASGGIQILNQDVVRNLRVSSAAIREVAAREEKELERREQAYRKNRPRLEVKDKTIIIVDDGLATGATMRAAVAALRRQNPHKIVVAVPVASTDTCNEFRAEVDDIICGLTPRHSLMPSEPGMTISLRQRMKRSSRCWKKPMPMKNNLVKRNESHSGNDGEDSCR